MIEQDRTGFAELMFALGDTYEATVTEARLEVYFRALSDVSLAEVRRAATDHVRTSRFFPKPADLLDAIRGNVDDRGELAWMALLAQVRRVGYTGTPDWPDDATRRIVKELFGGWYQICEVLPAGGPELLGWAKQFKAAYRGVANEQARRLAGWPAERKLPEPPPTLDPDAKPTLEGHADREVGGRE